jgi:hypothetical protein
MDILIFLPVFVAGVGCGYYACNWVRRRDRYRGANRDREATKPPLLTLETIRMSEVWRALRNLPPP